MNVGPNYTCPRAQNTYPYLNTHIYTYIYYLLLIAYAFAYYYLLLKIRGRFLFRSQVFFFRLHPRHPEEGQGREAAAHTALAAQASPAGACL